MKTTPQEDFLQAIIDNDLNDLKVALNKGVDLETKPVNGNFLLWTINMDPTTRNSGAHFAVGGAIRNASNHLLFEIHNRGFSLVNALKDVLGTPKDIIKNCDSGLFHFIEEFYPDLHGPFNETFPVWACAEDGDVGKLRCLIERGGDIEKTDPLGRTPIMCAERHDCVTLLFEKGANMKAKDQAGKTAAWHMARKIKQDAKPRGNSGRMEIEYGDAILNLNFLAENFGIENDELSSEIAAELSDMFNEGLTIVGQNPATYPDFQAVFEQVRQIEARDRRNSLEGHLIDRKTKTQKLPLTPKF